MNATIGLQVWCLCLSLFTIVIFHKKSPKAASQEIKEFAEWTFTGSLGINSCLQWPSLQCSMRNSVRGHNVVMERIAVELEPARPVTLSLY